MDLLVPPHCSIYPSLPCSTHPRRAFRLSENSQFAWRGDLLERHGPWWPGRRLIRGLPHGKGLAQSEFLQHERRVEG
jgi:hypothetical protein